MLQTTFKSHETELMMVPTLLSCLTCPPWISKKSRFRSYFSTLMVWSVVTLSASDTLPPLWRKFLGSGSHAESSSITRNTLRSVGMCLPHKQVAMCSTCSQIFGATDFNFMLALHPICPTDEARFDLDDFQLSRCPLP